MVEFGNKTNSRFIKLKGLEKASKEVYWEMGGERIEGNTLKADLLGISLGSYEFEGKSRETIDFDFGDSKLCISWNSLSRNILNSLASVDKIKTLELSLYINKAGYKAIGITVDGKRAEWKYSIEEQRKQIKEIKNAKGETIQTDFSLLDDMLRNEIDNINSKIVHNAVEEEEDLPFE